MIALKKAPAITPARIRTRVSMPPGEARRAICRTSAIAASAPAKAPSGRVQGRMIPMPVTVTATAPTAAPPDTPSTYGSASGLRRSA